MDVKQLHADRRAFVNGEARKLVLFVSVVPVDLLVGYGRGYTCECGFTTASSYEIFDHCKGTHGQA